MDKLVSFHEQKTDFSHPATGGFAVPERARVPALPGIAEPDLPRPLPSCAIMQTDAAGSRAFARIQRGTELRTKASPVCRFRTVYDVAIGPVAIAAVRFTPFVAVPPALGVPLQAGSEITLAIESTDPAVPLDEAVLAPIRVFIDTDDATRAALADALFGRTLCACVESGKQWCVLPALPFALVGLADSEALVPPDGRSGAGQRLLTEYFAFPEKFAFIDIDLQPALVRCPAGTRRLVLHAMLPDLRATAAPRLLRELTAAHLRLGCTPVVNLFSQAAQPVRIAAGRNTYALSVHRHGEAESGIYSLDAVKLLRRTAGDSAARDLRPFTALRHAPGDYYWLARRTETAGGTAHTVSFVDGEQRPLALDTGTVDVQLTCTNGTAPLALAVGRHDGDLTGDIGPDAWPLHFPLRFLRKPAAPVHAASQSGTVWRGLRTPSINAGLPALPALIDVLRLHAPAESPSARRQLAGIAGLDHRPATAWLRFPQGAAYLRGTEVRLTLDDAAFFERSLFTFAQVMDRFLAHYVPADSFIQLVVLSTSGEERVRCAPRAGTALPV